MPAALLPDRGLIKVEGPDAGPFLQGLLTNHIEGMAAGSARFAALLTPQGKIIADFFVIALDEADGGGFALDLSVVLVPDVLKRLTMYRLRAKVTLADISEQVAVAASWGDGPATPEDFIVVDDPRFAPLGRRVLGPRADVTAWCDTPVADYHARRIAMGVPQGGIDFAYGDAFPHEADMDALNGVDFRKGCYVGQEVVSRTQHRGTARTRIVSVVFPDGFCPIDGLDAMAGERSVGRVTSCANGRGVATLRLDKVADAMADGVTLTAGNVPFVPELPAFATFPLVPPARAGA
jgi:folate-binding protein YgfZ